MASSALSTQAILLPSLFILTRDELVHQVGRRARVLACSVTGGMARVPGSAGGQIISGLKSQRRDGTRAAQRIEARCRRTVRCAV